MCNENLTNDDIDVLTTALFRNRDYIFDKLKHVMSEETICEYVAEYREVERLYDKLLDIKFNRETE